MRAIDDWYLAELDLLYAELESDGGVDSSEVIAWHRHEIQGVQTNCVAYVLPGGNVRTLMSAIRLFAVIIPSELPVVAWSAGAMVLTDRIALFHDFGPDGASETEIFDRGLGRVSDVVAFPHARRRLRLDDPERLAIRAMRFDPAECVLLDDAGLIDLDADGTVPATARRVGTDGMVRSGMAVGA